MFTTTQPDFNHISKKARDELFKFYETVQKGINGDLDYEDEAKKQVHFEVTQKGLDARFKYRADQMYRQMAQYDTLFVQLSQELRIANLVLAAQHN